MKDREVTTRTIRHHTPEGRTEYRRFVVKYDRSRDDFYVEIPHFLIHENEDDKAWVRDTTPKTVLDRVEKICEHYRGNIVKKRRVLLVVFEGFKRNEKKKDRRHDEGVSLRLRWYSCWEFKVPGYKNVWEPGETSIQFGISEYGPSPIEGEWITQGAFYGDTFLTIEWTAERERYLASLEQSMNDVSDRMTEFFASARRTTLEMDRARGNPQHLLGHSV